MPDEILHPAFSHETPLPNPNATNQPPQNLLDTPPSLEKSHSENHPKPSKRPWETPLGAEEQGSNR
jgi:hypothetical protein